MKGLSDSQNKSLSNFKKDKANYQRLLNGIAEEEKQADLQLKTAKEAAKKFNEIITNAMKKTISIDSSARDLGYNIRQIELDAKQIISRQAADSIFQIHLTNELIIAIP